jgi:predicted RND superfamily exporter protein
LDKFDENIFRALEATVRGTGGALTVSILTLIFDQFGQALALSILFAYLASILITPSMLVTWDDLT